MKVSVVVATYGREQMLCETIAGVLAQTYADFELIVVDQSERHEPATEAFLVEHQGRLRYVREQRPSLPRARNIALQMALGDIVLFVDDDVLPDDAHLIACHAERYQDPRVGAVAGRVREPIPPNAPPGVARVTVFGRIVTNFMGAQPAEVEMAKGANMSCRREALTAIGGFDPRYAGTAVLEEADVCYRLRAAGWKIMYEPRASLFHRVAETGGCREANRIEGRYWLYHNSALFYRKLRPALGLPLFLAFFVARGMLHVAQAGGGIGAYLHLLKGMVRGYRAVRDAPVP